MDYNESNSHNKRKLGSGIYILIAASLLSVGVIAWFVMAGMTDNSGGSSSATPSVIERDEYNEPYSSYNEAESSIISDVTEPTADSVSDQPYSSGEAKPEKPSVFTMPVEGEVIKNFSDTALQFSSTYYDMRLHTAVDIACEKSTSVSACADGKVTDIGLNTNLGNVVTIEHTGGITVKYCAIDNLKLKKGDSVKAGDIIGTSATIPEECNDKPHIHIEVYENGKAIDPAKVLKFN